jgi:hypothetical protein
MPLPTPSSEHACGGHSRAVIIARILVNCSVATFLYAARTDYVSATDLPVGSFITLATCVNTPAGSWSFRSPCRPVMKSWARWVDLYGRESTSSLICWGPFAWEPFSMLLIGLLVFVLPEWARRSCVAPFVWAKPRLRVFTQAKCTMTVLKRGFRREPELDRLAKRFGLWFKR